MTLCGFEAVKVLHELRYLFGITALRYIDLKLFFQKEVLCLF